MILKAYAKINLSLDVLGRRPDGYHNISSLMQDIGLFDEVRIEKCTDLHTKYNSVHCGICGHVVYLCTNVDTIPMDENNLAIKGARAILGSMEKRQLLVPGDDYTIFIDKHLPVAAGIAGGSGNAAAVILGINSLAGNPFSLSELMEIGVKVGADLPFSLMMNAKKNQDVLSELRGIELASSTAKVEGIGEVVVPAEPVCRTVIMANPGIGVSTAAAYQAIDSIQDYADESGMFTNQLEKYTLANYPEAAKLKSLMQEHLNSDVVLMSGSGPTMVAYYTDAEQARKDYDSIIRGDWLGDSRVWLTTTGSVS